MSTQSIFIKRALNEQKKAEWIIYNELSQKTRFQSVRIVALCLYNIQRANLFFLNLSVLYCNILKLILLLFLTIVWYLWRNIFYFCRTFLYWLFKVALMRIFMSIVNTKTISAAYFSNSTWLLFPKWAEDAFRIYCQFRLKWKCSFAIMHRMHRNKFKSMLSKHVISWDLDVFTFLIHKIDSTLMP